jgi:son of sevenless
LYHWISNHYYDFRADIDLNEKMQNFLVELGETKMINPLKKVKNLLTEKTKRKATLVKVRDDNIKAENILIEQVSRDLSNDFNIRFIDINNRKIAEQLTLISFSCYRDIQAKEFLDKNWSNMEIKETMAPNILKMTQRNDKISLWIASLIVLEPRVEIRGKLISKFIQIADLLFSHNNFDGVMQIMAGLNNTPVHRLRRSWGLVDQKYMTKFKDMSTALDNKSNFKQLRDLLKNANPPCIPFLGIFLTDLTFIDDGNKDKINEMINFQKRRLYALSIKKLISFQQTQYTFNDDFSLKKYLQDLPGVDEEFDYQKKSLEIEPRAKSTIK